MSSGSEPLRLGIVGIAGRMGRELVACATDDPTVTVVGGVVRPGGNPVADLPTYERIGELASQVDVVLDFSTPDSTVTAVQEAANLGLPIVIGTTGLSPEQRTIVREASDLIPVWYGRNTSTGVSTLLQVLPEIARLLAGYDIEVIEAHHRHKVDAPSGTALALAEAILSGLDADQAHPYVHGREGKSPRTPGEIGMHAIRGGGNTGEHTIIFASEGDEVRISHRAYNRRAFAAGAIAAAREIAGREPGWYGPG